jgi:hypothetical protein
MLVLAEENAAAPLQKKGPSLATRAFFCNGGEGGIRTLEQFNPLHAFQACSFSRSDTSPKSLLKTIVELVLRAATLTKFQLNGNCQCVFIFVDASWWCAKLRLRHIGANCMDDLRYLLDLLCVYVLEHLLLEYDGQ